MHSSLQTRFFLAGCLLAVLTIATGLWSAWTFARLGQVVDRTLRGNQSILDLAAALANGLEREDDSLLLAISGDRQQAAIELEALQQRGDTSYRRLEAALTRFGPAQAEIAEPLRHRMDAYRAASLDLLSRAGTKDALQVYHARVNPLLRRAIQLCEVIREQNFEAMHMAGVRARDEARRAIWVVGGVCLGAFALAALVAVSLARSVVVPIRQLGESAEALREGDFDRRSPLDARRDELGQLADGFNRMAQALAEYRRSSLGELIAAKTTLEATLNALPDAVFVVAPDATFAAINPRARAVLAARRIPNARRLAELDLAPHHADAVVAALTGSVMAPARTDFRQALQVRLDGEPRKFLVTAVPIPEFAPQKIGAVVVLDDVTEFARLDELRGELIAVASHELKTPLTTLRMNLMMMGEVAEAMNHRQREMLEAALQGCEDLGSTIDELLDVTRIEAGQLRLELGSVNLAATLDSVAHLLKARFDDAGIRLDVRCEARPLFVPGDTSRLRTVIANVLSNALKYSPPQASVVVRIVSGQNAGGRSRRTLQLTVTDAGPGVPEEFRERVFEKFFRIEHHVDRGRKAVRGTGIGLYLCREIVRAHGGSIRCEPSGTGVGTSFVIELPAGA
ncbi:sensor histidine kinase [Singulisphaera acidiphila]|uniref:histidine kinase n=2 Tax=Singulisphaera acidiphila TaxID=466153 RepID=L0DNI4_SINAD|nr:ATP-binding protein [Singulisphaera acidiphila]AGA30827.1 signal transduction histidine kinase [Singulisphaera acidiphila DSM 18658]